MIQKNQKLAQGVSLKSKIQNSRTPDLGFFICYFLNSFYYFTFFLWVVVKEQLPWLYSVTSVSGSQIINNPCVWYSHNIPPIKMSNQNITQSGTQATGFGFMIGRCSPDSQYGRPVRHPANVSALFFRYMYDDLRNHYDQRPKRKTWTREDNQLALHCYYRSNPLKRIKEKNDRDLAKIC